MKKTLLLLLVSPFMGVGTISAQSQAKYGVIHYDSLLVATCILAVLRLPQSRFLIPAVPPIEVGEGT